jgi:Kef-type K+ transport system membrane component KefB
MRWFLFGVLAAASWAARVLGVGVIEDPAGSALISLSCLIVGGVLVGELAARWRLPRITGYLVLGMLAGPYALGLETAADARFLHLFQELALGLIALTAGGELRWRGIRRRAGPLTAITVGHVLGIWIVVAGAVWLGLAAVPFLGPLTAAEAVVAATLLGVIAVAVSPSTTIAVITETRARGELTDIVLGVTVLKDVLVLLLFAWVYAAARAVLGNQPLDLSLVRAVGIEIGLSLVVGCGLGLVLGVYLAKVGRHLELTVLALALVSVELGRTAPVEHLLMSMAVGFVVRNLFGRSSAGFLNALERSSAPVYVVFFALVGAGLDLAVFRVVWLSAALYAAVRLAAVWLLTRLPARVAGAGPAVVRWAWQGFIAQAGLSLGLAARIGREFDGFGERLATVVVAAVVVNQLVGPVLWARALVSSGEAGRADDEGRPSGQPSSGP